MDEMTPASGDGEQRQLFPHSFPRVGMALVDGTASASQAAAFVEAIRRWRPAAAAWIVSAAARGDISSALGDLLRWSIRYRAGVDRLPRPYVLTQIPDLTSPSTDAVQAVLAWRSGIVDCLVDIWDTIGPAEFELEECTHTVTEIFIPPALLGIPHCPDCLQTLAEQPDTHEDHTLRCPIRMRRLLD